jgi:multisubunit Na+/H+ antiporter MnhC subunit
MLALTPTTLVAGNLVLSALVVGLALLAMRIPAACRAVLRSRQRAEADYHSERLKL